jgi:uroporphyrinogen III methyltransferase/synthase
MNQGKVFLVGAGPGDPGLLTLKGAEVLAEAEVVVHDRLTDPRLLSLAPLGAELVDVGKEPDDRGDQEAINDLLVKKARAGRRVVRLKGGDPFVFGRGGEEALALQAAGVAFEVVPGVTSAVAAPAYAGVPVTQRGMVTSFTVVAGHSRSVSEGGTNWEALAAAGGTIVVLMGARHRAEVARRLLAGGLPPGTPVLAVQRGTEPGQSVVRTTLAKLAEARLQPPVTIVVGEVASLDLGWFHPEPPGPLAGKTVVVTRPQHQAGALSAQLRQRGARVVEVPAVEVAPPADGGAELAVAASKLQAGSYTWVAFTSANGVHALFKLVPDTRRLGQTLVAAVGPATSEALACYRVVADLVPEDHRAAGLLAAFPAGKGLVLLPQAAGARPELADGLAKLGWEVSTVEAYRTARREIAKEQLAAAARADAICFASPSALESYMDQAAAAGASIPATVACIGPVTAAAAISRGLVVSVEASEHTAAGLAEALGKVLGG